jgi:hypothetical protein
MAFKKFKHGQVSLNINSWSFHQLKKPCLNRQFVSLFLQLHLSNYYTRLNDL